jgi:hypothetical protein
MILTPFETIPCIDIQDIKSTLTGKDLFNKSMNISNPMSKTFINLFNRKRYSRYGYEGILPAEYSHEYHKIKNEWKRKVITIGVDDDLVIVVIKHIQMFQYVYERMEGLPISINDNTENEKKVFDILIENGIIKKVLAIYQEGLWLENTKNFKVSSEWNTYNYFTIVNEHIKNIYSNKWKRKNRINSLIKNPLLEYEELHKADSSIKSLSDSFLLWKEEIEKTKWVTKGLSKSFINYPYWKDDSVECILFKYDGFPIGWYANVIIDNKIAHEILEQSVVHMVFKDKEEKEIISNIPNIVKKRLGKYMHYIKMKRFYDRGVDVSYAGCVASTRNKNLSIFKKSTNTNCFGVKIYECS